MWNVDTKWQTLGGVTDPDPFHDTYLEFRNPTCTMGVVTFFPAKINIYLTFRRILGSNILNYIKVITKLVILEKKKTGKPKRRHRPNPYKKVPDLKHWY